MALACDGRNAYRSAKEVRTLSSFEMGRHTKSRITPEISPFIFFFSLALVPSLECTVSPESFSTLHVTTPLHRK